MKSIMEEASSIMKAIEKGWTSAGQPKEFTIKIFEEPQKNFIGLTVRPAKIGIFFTEQAKAEPQKQKRGRPLPAKEEQPHIVKPREPKQVAQRPLKPREFTKREPQREFERDTEGEQTLGPVWTDEMINSIKQWTSEILEMVDLGGASFTLAPERFYLKIQFSKSLYEDKNQQKHLFATLSHLLLTMLKRQYKRPLKGYKLVLTQE